MKTEYDSKDICFDLFLKVLKFSSGQKCGLNSFNWNCDQVTFLSIERERESSDGRIIPCSIGEFRSITQTLAVSSVTRSILIHCAWTSIIEGSHRKIENRRTDVIVL